MMKRYAMEFVGTFFLTVAISLMPNPAAIGLMLMAVIYLGAHISGANFNPAISFACMLQKRYDATEMAKYMVAQTLGALLALCFFCMVTTTSFALDIIPDTPILMPMAMEALFVLLFAWVYLTMNLMNRYKDTALAGLILGLTLCLMTMMPGGLFNPAVAVASFLCNAFKDGGSAFDMGSAIIYVVGPMVGALGASYMFNYFKAE